MSEARARRHEAATFDELIGEADGAPPGRGLAAVAGRSNDPADPTLRRMVVVTERLRGMEIDAGPSPDFRAALRARLLDEPAAAPARPARTIRPAIAGGVRLRLATARELLRFPQLGARTVARMAMLAMIVAMAGVLVIASRGALPGDSLYAVKRASERAELALTMGGESRGITLLSFAQTRLTEVDQLVRQQQLASGPGNNAAAGDVDTMTADLVTDALDDMDSDTRRGAKLLTNRAVEIGSTDPLALLSSWTAAHRSELAGLQAHLPAGVESRAQESSVLLDWVDYRVLTLQYSFAHACPLDLSHADELGPLPCSPEGTATALEQAPNSPAPPTMETLPPAPPGTGDSGSSATIPPTVPGPTIPPADPATPPGANPPPQPGQTIPPASPVPPGDQQPQDQQGEPPPAEDAPAPTQPGDPGTSPPPPPPPDSPSPAPSPTTPPSSCLLPGPLGQLLNICLG